VHLNKRIAKTILAVVVPLGMIGSVALVGGVASAKSATGTVTCTGMTASITFTPALVPGTATSKKESTTITNGQLTGCTGSAAGSTVTSGTLVAKPIKGKSNSCTSFATSAGTSKFSFTITWNGNGGSSKASFVGANFNTSPPVGFTLSNGKVTKSFATTSATDTADLDSTSTTNITNCVTDTSSASVAGLTISGGSATY